MKYALDKTLAKAEDLLKSGADWVVRLGRQVRLLFNMLKAWWDDQYEMPWGTVCAVTAALLYFVNPIDLIPDFLPLAGYLDDLAIIGICIKSIQSELRRYARAQQIDLSTLGL